MPNVAESALDAADVGGWELEVASGRLSWTPVTFRIHELDPSEAPHLDGAINFYAPDARPLIAAAVAEGISIGTPWDLELPFITARGRHIWVRACGKAVREGGRTVRLVGAFQDITVRRAMIERDARLSIIAQQMTNAVIMADKDGNTEWVNDALTRLTGYTLRDMRGRPPLAILSAPGTDPATAERMAQAVQIGAGFEADIESQTKDGRAYWVAFGCSLLRDAQGVVSGWVWIGTDITARRAAEETARREAAERARTEALLRDILEALPAGVLAYDPNELLVMWNSAICALLPVGARDLRTGLRMEDVLRRIAESGDVIDAGTTPEAQGLWRDQQLAANRASNTPRTSRLADGRYLQAREHRSATGNLVCVRTDVTDLLRTQALLRDVLDTIPSAVTAYDADERLILANRAYGEMFPIAAAFNAPGRKLEEVLRLAAEHGQFADTGTTPEDRAAWLARRMAAHRTAGAGDTRAVVMPDGRYVLARERRSEDGIVVCVRTDATHLKQAEMESRGRAERDALTGLANRLAFVSALERAVAAVRCGELQGCALLLLDVDYFKNVNDTLGHDVGDALLIEIAGRLRGLLRNSDLAARLGGDEFAVMIFGLNDPQTIAVRMDAIHAALSLPADVAGRRVPLSLSVGVTGFPADGSDAAGLLKHADLALYDAKRSGRGRWSAFRPEHLRALAQHERLTVALRCAVADNAIEVAFQPKRLLRGGHAGFEALARWHDGTRWVPPSEFIPVAEESGMILPLGRVVLAAALARTRQLHYLGLLPGRIAVNVTGAQLLDPPFKDETLAALRAYGLLPTDLELELTEAVAFGPTAERIAGALREFRALGVTVALDHFGTGYAALTHLARLPIDRLKIDRSFVEGLGSDGSAGVIAQTMIGLAHGLGIEAVAEGIETAKQLALLLAAGCDAGQGYLFARPLLTMTEVATYLRTQAAGAAGSERERLRQGWSASVASGTTTSGSARGPVALADNDAT